MRRLLVFASGSKEGGGSGFETLVTATRSGTLRVDIAGVVCNHEHGGVRERADRLRIPFFYFPEPYDAEHYRALVTKTKADFVALSGWLKLTKGLDPRTTFNIHPGPLPAFGGKNLYGHKVHEAVLEAYKAGRITHSAVSMHFVTDAFDDGPIFFSHPVPIEPTDTPETLAKRVNTVEHKWQAVVTDKVVSGEISWNGKDPESLRGALTT